MIAPETNDLAIADNLLSITFDRITEKLQGKDDIEHVLEVVIDETFHITSSNKDVISLCFSGFAIDNFLDKWEEIYEPFYEWVEVFW